MSMKKVTTAKELLDNFGKVQRKSEFNYPCPRCGHYTMDGELIMNSLSRRANVYICEHCGTDEAMLDYAGIHEDPESWSLVRSLRK